MTQRQIIKRDHNGVQKITYPSWVLEETAEWVCVEAFFQLDGVDIGHIVFRKNDRMVEWFYKDQYFNVFQIEVADTHRIKGWYCNITRPAEFTSVSIAADDLALDVFVSLDGVVSLLDEDEFAELNLSDEERVAVQRAIKTLKQMVASGIGPFAPLKS